MKIYIRTLWGNDEKPLWGNREQRDALRVYLNDQGFYVLTGIGDSLDIHVVEYADPWDVKILKKTLDKVSKSWYALLRKQKEAAQ